MNRSYLETLKITELKNIAKDMGLKTSVEKDYWIDLILSNQNPSYETFEKHFKLIGVDDDVDDEDCTEYRYISIIRFKHIDRAEEWVDDWKYDFTKVICEMDVIDNESMYCLRELSDKVEDGDNYKEFLMNGHLYIYSLSESDAKSVIKEMYSRFVYDE